MDWSGASHSTQSYWKGLLGDHVIDTEGASGDDIAGIISGIILMSAGTAVTKSEEIKPEEPTVTETTNGCVSVC